MFVLPRYFRGFDLTQCVARVNYCNPNGDANYYEADDLAETEGKATFTWLMAPDVTSYIGDVKFSIQLYKKDDTGKIIKNFNTKYATGKVLEGYNVEQSVTPEQQETLVEKLSKEVKDSISESLKTETSEAISADIEKKKTDALTEMNDKKTSAVNEIDKAKTSAVNEINSEQVVQDVSQLKEDLIDIGKDIIRTKNIMPNSFVGKYPLASIGEKIEIRESPSYAFAKIDVEENKHYSISIPSSWFTYVTDKNNVALTDSATGLRDLQYTGNVILMPNNAKYLYWTVENNESWLKGTPDDVIIEDTIDVTGWKASDYPRGETIWVKIPKIKVVRNC